MGARKKKNIRDHIFIINGIKNEALEKNNEAVDLVIVDYKQCFDSLWLEESMNDLFDAGITDDQLALIYKLNSTNQVAVKTPFGLTEKKTVERIVLQGEVLGPLELVFLLIHLVKNVLMRKNICICTMVRWVSHLLLWWMMLYVQPDVE